jgi:transcriptional regulator with XRE-family HTH domain
MAQKKVRQMQEIRCNIGMKIRSRRLTIGMTRKAFAEELDLSQASVSNIENGKQSLTAEKLWHVSLVLGCPTHDLLPPVPVEYQNFEEELHGIDDKKTREWGHELVKRSPIIKP